LTGAPDPIKANADVTSTQREGDGGPPGHTIGRTDIYRAAIDATTSTLVRRARNYRLLILAVACGTCAAPMWALIARSLPPLLLWVLVIVIVGVFFCIDASCLSSWRTQLLRPWERRELDFAALNAAIRAIPGLPGETVAAMLASLPQSADLAQERQWSVTERGQIAAALAGRDRRHATSLLLKTAMMAVTGIVGLWCAMSWR
jgi:hypothetical protein